jgi:putative sigma-54 modulation protein
MDIRIKTRNVEINDALKDYMESKMSKLEKFFSKIMDSQVVVSFNRGRYTVEVTSNANGVVMRGEERDSDIRKAFDKALKNIERQVKKHKDYLKDRAKLKTHDVSLDIDQLMSEFESEPESEESDIEYGIGQT